MRISHGRLTPFIWSGHSNTGSLVLDGSGRSLFYRNCSRFLLHQSVYLLRIYSTTYSTEIFNEYKLIAVNTLLTRDLVPFGAMFSLVVLFNYLNSLMFIHVFFQSSRKQRASTTTSQTSSRRRRRRRRTPSMKRRRNLSRRRRVVARSWWRHGRRPWTSSRRRLREGRCGPSCQRSWKAEFWVNIDFVILFKWGWLGDFFSISPL